MTPKSRGTSEESSIVWSFYEGIAALMMLVVFLGFWPSYFGPVLSGNPPSLSVMIDGFPWVIHLHAAVFMGWMLLLLAQTIVAAQGRMQVHVGLGGYGMRYSILVICAGWLIIYLLTKRLVANTEMTWALAPVALTPIASQIILFAVMVFLGYRYRSAPSMHKRFMLFATITLLPAASSRRLEYLLGAWSMEIVFATLVGLIVLNDYLSQRRIHRATLIGTGILLFQVILFHVL